MNQTPVNGYQMAQPQPQLSYNAVKIDVHNAKVMDGQPCLPAAVPQNCQNPQSQPQAAYNIPFNPYYVYPQSGQIPYYGPVPVNPPQSGTCTCPVHGGQYPVHVPTPAPTAQVPTPAPTAQVPTPAPTTQVPTPAPTAQTPQASVIPQPPTPGQVVIPTPVPVVPGSVQQVINNGVPTSQVINQGPQTQPGQQINNPATPVDNSEKMPKVDTPSPEKTMPAYDITPVLKGLQSNNMAEQAEALNKIGKAGDNPEELKHYLEPAVLDSLLTILHADTKGLEGPTKEQEEARDKWMKEKDLPEKDQTLSPQEKQLAMTLAPLELADNNKQFAMYSISILQKALADEIEKTNGEKISIEKLPAIDHIVNVLKSNPNPVLRASAIVALAHLKKDDFKPVLTDIFKLAQKDEDPNVQQVATEALERINLPDDVKQTT